MLFSWSFLKASLRSNASFATVYSVLNCTTSKKKHSFLENIDYRPGDSNWFKAVLLCKAHQDAASAACSFVWFFSRPWSYGSHESHESHGSHGSHEPHGSYGSHGSHGSHESQGSLHGLQEWSYRPHCMNFSGHGLLQSQTILQNLSWTVWRCLDLLLAFHNVPLSFFFLMRYLFMIKITSSIHF